MKRILHVVLCALCLSFSIAAAGETENVVKNLSFEDGAQGGPRGWERKTYSGKAGFVWAAVAGSGSPVPGGRQYGQCVTEPWYARSGRGLDWGRLIDAGRQHKRNAS